VVILFHQGKRMANENINSIWDFH